MHFETTSYPLDCPQPVWDALKEVQATDRNINDEIVRAIAAHVDDSDVDLASEQRWAVNRILERGVDERDH